LAFMVSPRKGSGADLAFVVSVCTKPRRREGKV
jgi:hypothetical protein